MLSSSSGKLDISACFEPLYDTKSYGSKNFTELKENIGKSIKNIKEENYQCLRDKIYDDISS